MVFPLATALQSNFAASALLREPFFPDRYASAVASSTEPLAVLASATVAPSASVGVAEKNAFPPGSAMGLRAEFLKSWAAEGLPVTWLAVTGLCLGVGATLGLSPSVPGWSSRKEFLCAKGMEGSPGIEGRRWWGRNRG